MKHVSKIGIMVFAVAVVTILVAGVARAQEGYYRSEQDRGYSIGVALTIGEGMYFINGDVYRSPASLEVVPSFGWPWFKFDLGLCTTLESIQIAGLNVGNWNFSFRPGGRVTPPAIPVYFRFAFPLQIQKHDFDWGVMLGLGADIRVVGVLGIVFEVDTFLTKYLEWGSTGLPLEFRIGLSFHI